MTLNIDTLKRFENHIAQHSSLMTYAKSNLKKYYYLFYLRRLAEFVLCGAFIYVGVHFLILSHFNLLIWPAMSVGLTIAFLRGNYTYIGIIFGAFFAFYFNSNLVTFSFIQALLFTLCIFMIRSLSLTWIGPVQPISQVVILLKFILIVAIVTYVHVLSNHLVIQYFGLPWPFELQQLYLHWLAELNGIFCLTIFSLVFDPFVPSKYFNFYKKNTLWILSLVIILGSHFCFIGVTSPTLVILMMLGFLISACLFAYYFYQIPTVCLLLGMGLLYLGGLHDFITNNFKNAYLSESYLTLFCVTSLIIATHRNKGAKE